MLEGQGILVEDESSTGVIRWYIVKVNPPHIIGKVAGQDVVEAFDREAVYNLAAPKSAEKKGFFKRMFSKKTDAPFAAYKITKEFAAENKIPESKIGGIHISIDEDEYNKARFAMFHYPVLKYNSQIGGFVTKDFLSNMEKEVFAEHGILNLNRKVQALDMWVKDLARHVVDTILKPKGMFGGSSWIWILLLVGLGLAAVMFGPQIWQSISGAMPHAAPTATGVGGGAAITPVK